MADLTGRSLDELMEMIGSGDREAFAALYRRCRPDVYRFAVHMSASPTVAEDVVQDVFLAVIQDADRYYPGRSGVLPWLLGIARHHVLRWRHRRPAVALPDDGADDARRLVAETDPIGDLTRQRQVTALSRAIVKLPPRHREVVVLCDLQEQSYETAAAVLGCAIGTVRSRLHRGRARLALALRSVERDVDCHLPAAKPSPCSSDAP